MTMFNSKYDFLVRFYNITTTAVLCTWCCQKADNTTYKI